MPYENFSLRATGCLRYPDAPEFFMQGENGGWHCAARREITERSEEAPAAKDAQPSKGDGRGKARRVLRGECRGGLGGAQPLTGPLCRPPRRRPKQHQRKTSAPAGRQHSLSKADPFHLFARRTGCPNKSREKAFMPAGQHKPISKNRP